MAHYEQQRGLFDGSRRRQVQQRFHQPPQHLFCPQPQQLGQYYGGPASGIWCERCGRAGHEAEMCAARERRRFNELCGTCSELGHLSFHCLLQCDRIYSDIPTLSSPPQINRSGLGGTGYDSPMSPSSYCGRSGGTGYDIPWSPPQYSGSNNGCGTNEGPQQQYGRGADCSAGYGATFAQQQTMSPPSYSGRSGGTVCYIPWSPPQYSGSNNGYGTKKGPQQQCGADGSAGYGATFAQQQTEQQPAPHPFSSFGWDQRYAYRNGPPVNGGLSNSIAQGQAQRDVGVDDQEEGQRPSTEAEHHGGPLSEVFGPPESVEHQRATTEMDCHGGPVSEVSRPPEAIASLARGGLPLQARHQRRLQPPSSNHLVGPSHRQPPLSRTRPLRSDFGRTIWRCRCSPSERDRSSRRRRQWHLLQQYLRLKR